MEKFFSSYINNFLKFFLKPTLSLNEKKKIILSNSCDIYICSLRMITCTFPNINFLILNKLAIFFTLCIYRGKD